MSPCAFIFSLFSALLHCEYLLRRFAGFFFHFTLNILPIFSSFMLSMLAKMLSAHCIAKQIDWRSGSAAFPRVSACASSIVSFSLRHR
jgi:hypothetical protein